MTVFRSLLLAASFVVSTGSAALAQDSGKGSAAAQAGDYATALEELRSLAEQGDAVAQYNLGIRYDRGLGVPRDNIKSHMWFHIAFVNRHYKARYGRNKIAEKMTPADISKAQSMARICMESWYEDCG